MSASPSPVLHRVRIADVNAHLFEVELHLARPAADQVVSMPVWIPGSYLIREFARHAFGFTAHEGEAPIAVHTLDKHRWRLACSGQQPVTLRYRVYAFDNSVRTAWLDAARGFFNATSLCLRVAGQTDAPQALELLAPAELPQWRAATALAPAAAGSVDARGFGRYLAADYDELADSPVELGDFWEGRFTACGVPHRFVVAGVPASFDGDKLLADTRAICEAEIRFWHPQGDAKPPFDHYLFMLNAVDDGYGGLEHRASTALICAQRDLPRRSDTWPGQAPGSDAAAAKPSAGYTTLLGLISHEYFHTWNVKRLRPAEFTRYDYDQENYTELLWFFEGLTSYYDDLLLRRAGLIDDATYLGLLTKAINQVQEAPGRHVQSVAAASFDAWVKYYRMDENTPNATISYYTKGALVGLCLDLTLRLEGQTPNASLDGVMRALWARCQGGPMQESDVAAVLEDLGGRSYADELARWVHGTDELPLASLLTRAGVQVHHDPAPVAQRLGLRCTPRDGGLRIQTVLRGSLAEQAGLAAGDDWLGITLPAPGEADPADASTGPSWRLRTLDDLPALAGPHTRVQALVGRGARLLSLPLQLHHEAQPSEARSGEARPGEAQANSDRTGQNPPGAGRSWRLGVADAAQVSAWLAAVH
ncbi:peptidase M61 [Comamonas serinivorans]|uniref:Peptidase M61 n=1 Tax=Comamonas serinivorans TaxID=1082851 RepID=A0A1Y0EMJ1_9BURK|nr:M61 family metallopeptidase [Comamonas serinivorans]ARU04522.1 peptidase M61 [Comamonas serinivorans]